MERFLERTHREKTLRIYITLKLAGVFPYHRRRSYILIQQLCVVMASCGDYAGKNMQGRPGTLTFWRTRSESHSFRLASRSRVDEGKDEESE